jgi:hypothetical protein
MLLDGETLALGLTDGETLELGLTLADGETEGLTLADGLTEGLPPLAAGDKAMTDPDQSTLNSSVIETSLFPAAASSLLKEWSSFASSSDDHPLCRVTEPNDIWTPAKIRHGAVVFG